MSVYLGFYLGHDSNVAVSIDGEVKYRKSERFFQKKHHRARYQFVLNTLKDWGIEKIDYCAYTDGNRQNLGECSENELFCQGFLKEFPSFCLDHHFAHILSNWPVVQTEDVDYSICIDGRGDWNRSMAIIESPAHNPRMIKSHTGLHMGYEFYLMGKMLGLKGMEYDLAGKVMGLHSYSDNEVYKFDIPPLLKTDYRNKLNSGKNAIYKSYKEWHQYWENYVHELFDFPEDKVLSYSGGCALNSVINYSLKKKFKNLHLIPHCYDGGLSLGCLEFLRLKFNDPPFNSNGFPFWQDDLIEEKPSDQTIKKAADMIANGKIIGWAQGRASVGPRALGNRSILMNATKSENKDILNNQVKKREPWRPYAGSVLSDYASEYFDVDESKYMLYACKVINEKIPAITHVDGTCRMQTVHHDTGPEAFYALLKEYYRITGIPVILNTSLNVMGDPIASRINNPNLFLKKCNLDALIVGDKIYKRTIKYL